MKQKMKGCVSIKLWVYICFLVIFPSTTAYSQPDIEKATTFKYRYLLSFETRKGKDEIAHGDPRTVAINSLDQAYVVIPYAKEVRAYGSQGEYLFTFGRELKKGEEEKGCFSEPSGIAIDNEDLIYISDLDRDMILIFDSKGEFKDEFPIFQPVGKSDACAPFISFNPVQKLLYIPDPCTQRVNIYKTSGTFITSFGEMGSEPGKFGGPANSAFDNEGGVFIVDPGNFRVQYLSPAHEPRASFGSMGTKEGEFVRPYGIAVDNLGRIFISDIILKSIQVFDRKSNFLGEIKKGPQEGDLFKKPLGIACSQKNRLYVVDGEAQSLHVFQID